MNYSLKTLRQMDQTKNLFSVENSIYFGLFLCAVFIRFLFLGQNPLSNSEATLALSALKTTGNMVSPIPAQPLYLSITSLFFLFFESSNFGARFLPAFTGSFFA